MVLSHKKRAASAPEQPHVFGVPSQASWAEQGPGRAQGSGPRCEGKRAGSWGIKG